MKELIPGLYVFDEIGAAVHAYAWVWQEGVTLIDTGMPNHAPLINDALIAHGFPLHRVKRIVVTHCDVDHMGGLAQLRKATHARVACHTVEKALLEKPSQRRPTYLLLRPVFRLVTLAPGLRSQPVSPDELLVDGQELAEGFTVIHTPGHTAGHISLLHRQRRFLITGDALSNRTGKLTLPPPLFTPDMHNAQRSLWKLAKKYGDDFDAVFFGHGEPILNNGSARVKSFAAQVFSAEM